MSLVVSVKKLSGPAKQRNPVNLMLLLLIISEQMSGNLQETNRLPSRP